VHGKGKWPSHSSSSANYKRGPQEDATHRQLKKKESSKEYAERGLPGETADRFGLVIASKGFSGGDKGRGEETCGDAKANQIKCAG